MPIYEYQCSKCHSIFEEWVKHFDSPEHEPCPKCGGDASRIVSNTSFVLKGGGWYVTEYGNHKKDHESGAGAPGEDQPAASGAEAKNETPAPESKSPATQSESPAAQRDAPKETASSPKETSTAASPKDSPKDSPKTSGTSKNTAAA